MRISTQTPTYQPVSQPRRASSGSGSFGEQLDIAARRGGDQLEVSTAGAAWQNAREMEPSPYLKLLYSYDAWKAKQPPRDLPDSWGPTEENLAYLKEHYSGDLSWEERVDALETMEQMGVITEDQKYEALEGEGAKVGPPLNIHDQDEMKRVLVPQMEQAIKNYHAYKRGGWDACFQDRPIGSFKTADDLFSWLDNLLESES